MNNIKKTKIVATIGPVTSSEEMLTKLLQEGMNVVRINFSHGDFAEHQVKVNNGRAAYEKTGIPVAFLQDLGGPKIRIGEFNKESVNLKEGEMFTLTTEKIIGDEKKVYVNYPLLPKEVKVGGTILLHDGKKKLEIVDIKGNEVKCKIIVGGDIKGKRGVNLPGAYLSVSSITEKDIKDLEFGIKNKVDFVALSFVRKPDDITKLRNILDKAKLPAGIIAKIETPEAVNNIDKIIELSDGIMVARGDLAIEVPAEDVPLIQKMIIEKCNKAGKPVITATQMLESMIKSPVPTRAEVSDVANAILDGTDAVMLSEETTLGDYPVEAVKVMTKVAMRVEGDYIHKKINGEKKLRTGNSKDTADSITKEAVDIAQGVDARFIVGLTESGFSARMISRYRPAQNIVAMTPNKNTFAKLILSYGVAPVLIRKFKTLNEAMVIVRNYFIKNKLAKKGDKAVVVAGMPFDKKGATNMILVEKI